MNWFKIYSTDCTKEHETFTTCAMLGCGGFTCQQPDYTGCTNYDCTVGCFCNYGYIRQEETGECVLPSQCWE